MSNDQSKSMENLSHVIDYPARDMTITVSAAMNLGQLRQILASEKQQLPIDAASDEIAVGDLVAFDISGPRQYGYGTLRDYVIGIEATDGNGRVFHAGGRVVKNVAGYDLCRLLIGAEGKLGTLRQLTFKLKPLPVEQHISVAGFRTLKNLDAALERINLSSTTPQILDVANYPAAQSMLPAIDSSLTPGTLSENEAFLILGFDGTRKACEWQTTTIAEELHGTASFITLVATPQVMTSYCRAAMQSAAIENAGPTGWWMKVTMSPSRVASVLQIAKTCGLPAFGRAGNGIVYMHTKGSIESGNVRDQVAELVASGLGHIEIRERDSTFRHPPISSPVERYVKLLTELLG